MSASFDTADDFTLDGWVFGIMNDSRLRRAHMKVASAIVHLLCLDDYGNDPELPADEPLELTVRVADIATEAGYSVAYTRNKMRDLRATGWLQSRQAGGPGTPSTHTLLSSRTLRPRKRQLRLGDSSSV